MFFFKTSNMLGNEHQLTVRFLKTENARILGKDRAITGLTSKTKLMSHETVKGELIQW